MEQKKDVPQEELNKYFKTLDDDPINKKPAQLRNE